MTSKAVYAFLVVFVTMLALAVANVAYTNHVDRLADRRNQQRARDFCGVITLLDDRNQRLPLPSTKDARDFVVALHQYRLKLGC